MIAIPDNLNPANLIPENVREVLASIWKYHFWIVAAIVPLILLPLLSLGAASLQERIAAQQRAIEGKRSQVKAVVGIAPHPNRQWSEAIETRARNVGDETRREWQRLWDSQASLRVWPAELGDDFVAAVQALRPGDRLERPALLNYQRRVQRFARGLAERMGVPEEMGEQQGAAGARTAGRGAEEPAGPRPLYTWNAADQQRLWKTFSWGRPPSTEQVLLAQQELWAYGQFCDLIRGFNTGATGPHDVAITRIEQLAVGYPAAEDAPGGRGTGRLVIPPPPAASRRDRGEFGEPAEAVPEPPVADAFGAEEAVPDAEPFVRPPHPRFSDGREAAESLPGEQWNWAYVDFAGQPLLAGELAAAPGLDMVRLMPFVLRVVMDQRQLDRLLVALAEWPVPIDVRQVRINASGGGTGGSGRRGFEDGESRAPEQGGSSQGSGDLALPRRYDMVVELRGSVALATPPESAPATVAPASEPAAEAF